jgi:hypothetical protein
MVDPKNSPVPLVSSGGRAGGVIAGRQPHPNNNKARISLRAQARQGQIGHWRSIGELVADLVAGMQPRAGRAA